MTFLPSTVGSEPVSATIDNTVADAGLAPFPNSPNFGSGESSTTAYEISSFKRFELGHECAVERRYYLDFLRFPASAWRRQSAGRSVPGEINGNGHNLPRAFGERAFESAGALLPFFIPLNGAGGFGQRTNWLRTHRAVRRFAARLFLRKRRISPKERMAQMHLKPK